MSKVIEAIFEDGVFKPLGDVTVQEHERVAIKIIPLKEWQERFSRVINKIHEATSQFSPEELDADIEEAIREVRAAKRGR